MRTRTININALMPFTLGFLIYCAYVGKIDWWVFACIILPHMRFDLTFTKKG